jgi:hypothetical protein
MPGLSSPIPGGLPASTVAGPARLPCRALEGPTPCGLPIFPELLLREQKQALPTQGNPGPGSPALCPACPFILSAAEGPSLWRARPPSLWRQRRSQRQ